MMSPASPSSSVEIAWLEIADPPELWADLGYDVDASGTTVIGGLEHRLIGPTDGRKGIVRWVLRGAPDGTTEIDGIETGTTSESALERPSPVHENGVTGVDHVVMATPSTPRTVAALEAVGLSRRGHRDTNSAGDSVDMTFFWMGDQLLELAGPAQPDADQGAKPARLMGVAYVSDDLDATAAWFGTERCTTPHDAVQPGRRICALKKPAGCSVPSAFMTPHIRTR